MPIVGSDNFQKAAELLNKKMSLYSLNYLTVEVNI